jgi:PilZ domain
VSIFDSLRKLFQRPQEIRMPRRWQRIVMSDATVVSLSGGQRQPVKLANLSAGGARIMSSFAMGTHERVTLTVPLGAGSRKELHAEVVYCNRDEQSLYYAGGLSFLGAGREGVEDIATFIEEERRRRSGAGEMWQG